MASMTGDDGYDDTGDDSGDRGSADGRRGIAYISTHREVIGFTSGADTARLRREFPWMWRKEGAVPLLSL